MQDTSFIFRLSEHEKKLLEDSARMLKTTKAGYLRNLIVNMAQQLGLVELAAKNEVGHETE